LKGLHRVGAGLVPARTAALRPVGAATRIAPTKANIFADPSIWLTRVTSAARDSTLSGFVPGISINMAIAQTIGIVGASQAMTK
jgi:hypothetical protein